MWYEKLLEKNIIPDFLIRFAIRKQLAERLDQVTSQGKAGQEAFVKDLKQSPIAICTRDANEQHYEVPPEFFHQVLGKHLKYSCGYWPEGVENLDDSEKAMLDLYAERAELTNGQKILDLGCGWGSLSLYLAAKYPNSEITGVSNSRTQKEDIERTAKSRGLNNLKIITCDMNDFDIEERFDRILSIEMFEHMRNYDLLFKKVASWLKPEGKIFVHIFCHKNLAYPFVVEDENSWMARYFFAGGIMPSFNFFNSFSQDVFVKKSWEVNGQEYQKTCEAWLKKQDQNKNKIFPLFEKTYGKDQALKWWVYWRIFFMACAELFGYRDGEEWFVGHYLMEPVKSNVGAPFMAPKG